MTNILLRLFIKNCEDTQNPAVRSSIGKLAGLTGIVCNCLLTVLKLVIGLLVGSMAIIADGVNNLSDAASSLTTLLGFRMAQRPADKQHPYGHARYEYLSGLAVAALILLIGAELVKSSIAKIINPEPIDISAATIALLAASVAVKLWMSGFYKTLGKKINSTALYATSVDSRNDVISTCAVLLGCLVNYLFGLNIDGYVGLAVAISFCIQAWASRRTQSRRCSASRPTMNWWTKSRSWCSPMKRSSRPRPARPRLRPGPLLRLRPRRAERRRRPDGLPRHNRRHRVRRPAHPLNADMQDIAIEERLERVECAVAKVRKKNDAEK